MKYNNIEKICSGIYKITSPSGKIYIGQAKNLKKRINSYKTLSGSKGQPKLYNSFKKHGIETHQFDIIEYCSVDQLNCSERFWQNEFDVLGYDGLNCILTECGARRTVYSEESRNRMSEKQLGEKNHRYGKTHSEEWCKAMSERMSGVNHPNYGKSRSKETIEKTRQNTPDRSGDKCYMSELVVCLQTGIFYDSAKQAGEAYNISRDRIYRMLNGEVQNVTNLVYVKNYYKGMKMPKYVKYKKETKRVLDTSTSIIYNSAKEVCEIFNINYNTLKNKLNGTYKNNTNFIYL